MHIKQGTSHTEITVKRIRTKHLPVYPKKQAQYRSHAFWGTKDKNLLPVGPKTGLGKGKEKKRKKRMANKKNCKAFCVSRNRNKRKTGKIINW